MHPLRVRQPPRPIRLPRQFWLAFSALAAVGALCLVPVHNPDLFWHLRGGLWILDHGALPVADSFSFTEAGKPWVDFEWAAGLVYGALYAAGGTLAWWLFKAALLAAIAALLCSLIKESGSPPAFAPLGLLLWAVLTLPGADLKPDLFSVLAFAWQLRFLERMRRNATAHPHPSPPPRGGREGWGGHERRNLAGICVLYSVWGNLHAGFAAGLGLFGIYAAAALASPGGREEAWAVSRLGLAAFAGTWVSPYWGGAYAVLWEHWRSGAQLAGSVDEWRPMPFSRPFWPAAAAALAAAAAGLRRRRKSALGGKAAPWPAAPLAAGLVFFAAAALHRRLEAYFAVLLPLSLGLLLKEAGFDLRSGKGRAALALACVAAFSVLIPTFAPLRPFKTFDPRYVPRRAAEWMGENRAALSGRRTFNLWGWGGYLEWRLADWYRSFADGRYIFRPLNFETSGLVWKPEAWQKLMDSWRLDSALVPRIRASFPSTRLYPSGARRRFLRPWYLFHFPRSEWALVYWDSKALFFARRRAFAGTWLSRHEYRYWRPDDAAAFEDARSRGEIPPGPLKAERARHERELAAAYKTIPFSLK